LRAWGVRRSHFAITSGRVSPFAPSSASRGADGLWFRSIFRRPRLVLTDCWTKSMLGLTRVSIT